MKKIHPTASVDPKAVLGNDVEVGPYSIIGPHVKIGNNTRIGSHVEIKGHTDIGSENVIMRGTGIGEIAQDFSFKNFEGKILIGDKNVFRENCTVHLPTDPANTTTIGNHCYFMINAHVAHDCVVEDHAILVNNCALAGYVTVGRNAYISHAVGIVQFCRVGAYSIVGAVSKVAQDLPPYMLAIGTTATVHGLNVIGMKRAGFGPEERKAVKEAFKALYFSRLSLPHAISKIESEVLRQYPASSKEYERVAFLVDFLKTAKKGILGYAEYNGE